MKSTEIRKYSWDFFLFSFYCRKIIQILSDCFFSLQMFSSSSIFFLYIYDLSVLAKKKVWKFWWGCCKLIKALRKLSVFINDEVMFHLWVCTFVIVTSFFCFQIVLVYYTGNSPPPKTVKNKRWLRKQTSPK